jgi:undecaprenyl diphosphate synthase
MSLLKQIDTARLPSHIAIIMDGHQQGVKALREVIEASAELKIRFLTVYAFSTENWGRPDEEVSALMGIMVQSLNKETDTLIKNNIRLTTIGDTERLASDVKERLMETINVTSDATGLNLIVAMSYSSRWEMTEAAKRLSAEIAGGSVNPGPVNEFNFEKYLTTHGVPDPELMIRTSGEMRISNFLLWQLAYTELYFTEILWPDFGKEELYKAIIEFQKRERRFGKTSEQLLDK